MGSDMVVFFDPAIDCGLGLAGVFIHHCQHFIGPAIAELVMDEVNRPNMIWIFWAQADHRCIFVVKPLAIFVAGGQLQPFLAPKPFNLLVIKVPALCTQKLGNHSIAVSAILLGKPDQIQPERIIVTRHTLIAHRRTRNTRHRTNSTFRNTKLLASMNNHAALIRYTQAFGFK